MHVQRSTENLFYSFIIDSNNKTPRLPRKCFYPLWHPAPHFTFNSLLVVSLESVIMCADEM